jgi:hypothetical protein
MTSPMNDPAVAATELIPSAMPRWVAGKASVRVAEEFANIIAPPTPCSTPQQNDEERRAPAMGVDQRQPDRARGEDGKAEVVDADPPDGVAEAAERDHEHRRDH